MTNPIKIISAEEYGKEYEKPNQEKIWDNIAAPWRTYVVKKIPVVEEFLKDKKGKIIDLGCGNGRNMIPNGDMEYYGVDFSSGQLKHAEKAIEEGQLKAKLFKSDLDKLPENFKDEMFDYGLFISTLHCLETSEERENSLKEFYRVLKRGGEGLVSVWNSEDARFKGVKGDIYMSWRENNIPYMRHYYLYSKEELIKLLEWVGFKILEVYSLEKSDRFSKKNWIVRVKK